ncbi:hypothetical protein GCM10020256_62930 [Streptomyces thermocoprophilus]
MPTGDLVRFELAEEDAQRPVHGVRQVLVVGVAVHRLHPPGLCQQPLLIAHGVVAADEHAERAGLLGTGVGRHLLAAGDLEGRDLVVAVVEQLVVRLGRRGQLVERLVDGRVVLPRPGFDRGQVAVERGFDRFGGGAYLGSGGLRSIRHTADAIRSGPRTAQ